MSRNTNPDAAASAQAGAALRHLSAADWAAFGLQHIAYIRPVLVNGVRGMSIHAADGTPIGAAPDARLAMAAILQHEMEPAWVH
jgi:hypothetical protein